ncbi:MAG: hypothetical protein LBK70_02370 [Clostridiales bacterium]|jgi:ribonuclease-3|nr:hypothetical protein [Clostridiales bacterium]
MKDQSDIVLIQDRIGYIFGDVQLLRTAFVQPSYAHDNDIDSYDRLEHLGDSVLGLCTTKYLYNEHKQDKVDNLTERRKEIVSNKSLAIVFDKLALGQFAQLSKNQQLNDTIKSDIVEALIGAIYLDSQQQHDTRLVYDWIVNNVITVELLP